MKRKFLHQKVINNVSAFLNSRFNRNIYFIQNLQEPRFDRKEKWGGNGQM